MNKPQNQRIYKQQPSELNSTMNPLDLIAPSQTDTSLIPQISPVVTSQVVKRNPEVNNEIAKSTLNQINQISNQINNTPITNNNQTNSIDNTNNSSNTVNTNLINNGLTNSYNGSLGGNLYGGLSGYGNYGNSYGTGYGGYNGYGSMYGGYGGYGGMYGGYGSRGMYGRNPNENPDFFEKSFMVMEKLNFHIFNFCEMVRMMQNQTPAMLFLYDLMKKGLASSKNFFKNTAVQFISSSKIKLINTFLSIRKYIYEFFLEKDLSNEKLKNHIRILDMMIIALLISAVGGLFLKIY